MIDARTEVSERIARQLASLPDAELKSMLVKVSGPILAELRRRGCEFSIGTDGIDGAQHPNAATSHGQATGLPGSDIHTHGGG